MTDSAIIFISEKLLTDSVHWEWSTNPTNMWVQFFFFFVQCNLIFCNYLWFQIIFKMSISVTGILQYNFCIFWSFNQTAKIPLIPILLTFFFFLNTYTMFVIGVNLLQKFGTLDDILNYYTTHQLILRNRTNSRHKIMLVNRIATEQ